MERDGMALTRPLTPRVERHGLRHIAAYRPGRDAGHTSTVDALEVPGHVGGGRAWGARQVAARGDLMTSSTMLLPFQPATMSKAQLAAVSFLAR
jgi:hypothetical protein